MKRVFVAGAVLISACRDQSPSVAATIALNPAAITFDAIGATKTVTAQARDQRGRPVANSVVRWAAGNENVTVVPDNTGSSAVITSARAGTSTVTVVAGASTATLQVSTVQAATAIDKVGGDNQGGAAGRPLEQPLALRVVDRLGAPIAGQTVTFTVVSGGGSVSPATAITNASGVATSSWTLGADRTVAQRVSASVPSVASPVTYTAAIVAGGAARIILHVGSNEVALAGTQTEIPPAVLALDDEGRPVPGVDIAFAVTGGGGSVANPVVRTNKDGFAINPWTLGPVGMVNTLTASAAGLGTLEFTAVGCDHAGGTGYTITLCYRTPVTASQRKAFADGAARWTSIITGDLPDMRADASAGACDANSPSLHMTIDDLLIFVSVEPIDGPGGGTSQAGWCFRRDGGLPLVGLIRFDSADIDALATSGQLMPTMLHNFGHAIGVGTMWAARGLVQNPTTPGSPVDSYFSGVNAIAAFDEIGGASYAAGRKVPVENIGGAGTVNTHWRESVFATELMSSVLSAGANPLSLVTVRSLEDLGYTVNRSAADPFTLPTPGSAMLRAERVDLQDAYVGAQWTLDTKGRLTRIRRYPLPVIRYPSSVTRNP